MTITVPLMMAPTVKATTLISMNPTSGHIGTTVNLVGTIDTQGGAYSVYFDPYDSEVPFLTGELVATGNTPAGSYSVNATFVVPDPETLNFSLPLSVKVALVDGSTFSYGEQFFYVLSSLEAHFTYSPTSPHAGESIIFDGSSSFDSNGVITNYFWEFRDAITDILLFTFSSASFNASFSFTSPGDYNVTLTVTDNTFLTDSTTTILTVFPVPLGPTANFTFFPISPVTGEEIIFDASGSTDPDGIITNYFWEFRDAITDILLFTFSSASFNASFSFTSPGDYNVTLTVTDNTFLTDSTTTILTVFPVPLGPTANFTFFPISPIVGDVISFDASSSSDPDGTILFYFWDMGDGTIYNTSSSLVTHSYANDGSYTATLMVTDDVGLTDTTNTLVTVQPPQYELVVDVYGSGSTDPPPNSYMIEESTLVNVEALSDSGWKLDYWMLDGVDVGGGNSYTVIMDAPHTLTAVFYELPPQTVVLNIAVVGSGSTDPSSGDFEVDEGTVVEVVPIPDEGWEFDYWLLDGVNVGSGSSYSVTMDDDHELTAIFIEGEVILDEFELIISIGGSGTIDSASGTYTYDERTVVVVDALPDSGWKLDRWLLDGEDAGNASSFSIVMDDNHVLSAIFTDISPPLISVLAWNPKNPLENEDVDVQFLISSKAGDITEVIFWCRVSGGEWEEASLDFDGETWTAAIPGHKGGEIVDFYIECSDNFGNLAISEVFSYPVREIGITLDLVLAITAGISGATLGGIGAYRVFFLGKSLSSEKIMKKVEQKRTKEMMMEAKENKKRKRESKKRKPYLKVKIGVPFNLISGRSYKAKVEITNSGQAPAKSIQIKATSTPGLTFDKELAEIDDLKPDEEKPILFTFPFRASEQIKKGIYNIRFKVTSKNTKDRIYNRYLRGLRIAMLLDPNKLQQMHSLQQWLKKRDYAWDEISKAHEFLKLLQYDLLISAPEVELGKKDIHNISKFVEKGQSILAIDKIVTHDQKGLAKILGYNGLRFEVFKSMMGVLKINNNQHFITKGFALEEKIPIGVYWGNASISDTSGEIIAVQTIKTKKRGIITIPAIMINKYGKGKTLHLNFHAEETLSQINNLLENAINWLLNEH